MAFTKRYSITIDNTKCGSADTTDFVLTFYGTYAGGENTPDLRTTGNGGDVTDANGYDICFYSDSACTTMLDFERTTWSGTTGACEFHVRVPTVNGTGTGTDTVIYLGVGNSDISTDQQDADGTWVANYKAVCHFEQYSGTQATDTSGSGNHGTATNAAILNQSGGQIGYKSVYVTASSYRIGYGDSADFKPTGAYTIAFWMNTSYKTDSIVFSNMNGGLAGYQLATDGNGYLKWSHWIGGSSYHQRYAAANFCNGAWYRVILLSDGSTYVKIYANGSQVDTNTLGSAFAVPVYSGTHDMRISSRNYSSTYHWTGSADEFYFINGTEWTPSQVTADYNNQNSPSTFYTLAEVGGAPAATIIIPNRMILGVGY